MKFCSICYRRIIALFAAVSLAFFLLAGCGNAPAGPTTDHGAAPAQAVDLAAPTPLAQETAAATVAVRPAVDPELPSITWATAFRDDKVPEGVLPSDCVAFLHKSGDGSLRVFNVPKEEIYANRPERLPRTRFFEQYMPQELVDELLPVLDYAVANGCSRFCIPATAVNYSMIRKNGQYLSYTYDINDQSRIDPLPIKSITGENVTVNFVLVILYGMEKGNTIDRYRDGLAAAQAIVDAIPEGLDDQGKMLYLYRYLTENVRYYEGDYYGGSDWCLLYDALVQHSTVCTGYTEALYVLCNLAGIECFNVSGEVGELLSGGMHAWNVARINGQYYEFDATWDEGLPPADYRFFGMSTAYSLENHTRLMRSFDLSFCPDCPENLLPEALLPASENDPAYPIFWYYLLRNAMDASPEKMFEYLGYEEDQIRAVEPKNGWITTEIQLSEFCTRLCYVMTPGEMSAFIDGSLISGKGGKLMIRVPEEEPLLLRLVGVEKNADGTWTASLLEITPDGNFIPREQRITLVSSGGFWYVDSVE